jgi:hypothetical protein
MKVWMRNEIIRVDNAILNYIYIYEKFQCIISFDVVLLTLLCHTFWIHMSILSFVIGTMLWV